MVPTEVRQILEPLMPGRRIPWEQVNLHVRPLSEAAAFTTFTTESIVPLTRITTFPNVGVRRMLLWPHRLITAGMAIGREIFIVPSRFITTTAAGLALIAHELVHVDQHEKDPNFLAHYREQARNTPRDRPWENPYEREAYLEERRVYCTLTSRGMPSGKWTPLGVSLWGC